MKVQTDSITVTAGQSASVKIRSTIPIRCDIYKNNVIPCKYRFEMLDFRAEITTASNAFCAKNKKTKASKLCGVEFDAWDWKSYQTLKIPTKPNQQIQDHFPAVVRLKTNNKVGGDELWNDYQLPDVKVKLKVRSELKSFGYHRLFILIDKTKSNYLKKIINREILMFPR